MGNKSLYVIGDSISKGIVQNLEEGKKYSVYPDNTWNKVAAVNNLDLTNKSVFGCTIAKGHRQLTKDLQKGIHPDAIVIEFGGNDSDYRWPEYFEKGGDNFFPNTSLDDFERHLVEMVSEIRAHKITPVLMTLPPLVSDNYFNVISEGLDKEALLSWMGDAGFLYREQELYSDTVARVAYENKVFLIDLRKQFLLERKSRSLMCPDGIHPNIQGHAFMASYLTKICKEKKFVGN